MRKVCEDAVLLRTLPGYVAEAELVEALRSGWFTCLAYLDEVVLGRLRALLRAVDRLFIRGVSSGADNFVLHR